MALSFEPADQNVAAKLQTLKKSLAGYPSLLKRSFVKATPPDQASGVPSNGVRLRVMQFNALANALCIGADNFVRCPQEALAWPFRKLRILEELLTYNADIICLQEVDDFTFFRTELAELGYCGLWFPKPSSPCLDVPGNIGSDGCAFFYNASKFGKVSHDLTVVSSKTGPTNQVLIIVQLSDRCGHQFCVAVTHLKARSHCHELRLEQGHFVLERLAKTIPPQVPIIVCGDFNAPPSEPVVHLFRNGLPRACTFESAHVLATGSEIPYTTWKFRGQCDGLAKEERYTLDYIWCSRPACSVEAVLGLPSTEEISPDLLPSLAYASDHLSLVADLLLVSDSA